MEQHLATFRRLALAFCIAIAGCASTDALSANVQFVGNVGYTYAGSTAVLTADRVENFTSGGTSGTLHMELWALPTPYNGSNTIGYKLAQYNLGQLQGGYYFYSLNSGSVAFTYPPNGTWAVAVILTEYDAGPADGGFSERDYVNFPQPLVVGTPAPSPGQLSLTGAYTFSNQPVGTPSAPASMTVTNVGGTAVSVSGITSNNLSDFSVSSSTCSTVGAGGSCSIGLTFRPSLLGVRNAIITVASSGVGSPQYISVTGTGITNGPPPGKLSVTSAVAYGNVTLGTTAGASVVTVTNVGGIAVFISSIASSNPTEFPITSSNCGTVNPSTSCTFSFVFSPSAVGGRSATITISSNGVGSPQTVSVSGNGVAGTLPPAPATVTLIEYYHSAFDHYFITSIAAEISGLDSGTIVGWARTGQQFNAYTLGAPGSVVTCRFFSATFAPKSSHFYTPNASECSVVKANPNWQFEGEVFGVALPDAVGNCPAGTVALYRAYNNGQGAAPNHRYMTSLSIRQSMLTAGWIPEGSGSLGVIACVPQATAPVGTAEGLWSGTSSRGESIVGIVLDDGTYYFLYTVPGTNSIAGVVQGNATSSNGQFTSSNAKDFNFTGLGIVSGTLAGSYTAKASLSGVVSSAIGSVSFNSTYQSIYEQPASLAAAAGSYSGSAMSSLGVQPVAVAVGTNGTITGSGQGCTFSGTAAPRGSVDVFNLTVTFNGGLCLFGTSTLTGIAYYDAPNGQIYGVAPNATRTDGFLFVGTKP